MTQSFITFRKAKSRILWNCPHSKRCRQTAAIPREEAAGAKALQSRAGDGGPREREAKTQLQRPSSVAGRRGPREEMLSLTGKQPREKAVRDGVMPLAVKGEEVGLRAQAKGTVPGICRKQSRTRFFHEGSKCHRKQGPTWGFNTAL